MKANPTKVFILIALLSLIFGCTKEEKIIDPAPTTIIKDLTVNGFIQKGPFIQGSEVRIQILNQDFLPTGNVYFTETLNDFGSFLVNITTDQPYLDVSTTGFYFNEITGELSAAPISLKTMSRTLEDKIINVNILTTMEFDRIEYLIKNKDLSFDDARIQAEKEILSVFKIHMDSITGMELISFDQLDISNGTMNDAILIAISSILQYNNSEAELSEMVKKISDDIKEDGILNNNTIINEIVENSKMLDCNLIRNQIIARYQELGHHILVRNFEGFIDHDGNGLIDLFQNPTPIISPAPQSQPSDNPIFISITVSNGVPIYYTLDGTIPTIESTLYTEPFYIGLGGQETTVSAKAISDDLEESALASYTYDFKYHQAFCPKFNLFADTYNHDILLELHSETSDVAIFYTTDGSIPDSNSFRYTEPISIQGNGTIFEITTKAFHQYLESSIVVKSYYKIDYNYEPDTYMDTLSFDDYQNAIVGKWLGHVDTPWTGEYNVFLQINPNGNYSCETLSAFKYTYGDEVSYPVFYYGNNNYSPFKTFTINELYADGKAKGELIIWEEGLAEELKHISFSNNLNHLEFEVWHHQIYGPLVYSFTRLP